MSTTKYQLAELIQLRLEGGALSSDALEKLDKRVLFIEISNEYSNIILEQYWIYKSREDDSDFLLSFLTPYTVDVKKDTVRNRYYSILPAQHISLPEGKGVFLVHTLEDEANPLIPLTGANPFLFTRQESEGMEGREGYKLEGSKLWYYFKRPEIPSQLTVQMVAAIQGLGATDPLPITSDIQNMVVDRIVAKYQPVMAKPVDKIPDTTDYR